MNEDYTFNCHGKININDYNLNQSSLIQRKELENVTNVMASNLLLDEVELGEVELFDSVLPKSTAILDLKHFIKCLDMNLKILNRYEQYNYSALEQDNATNFYAIRKMICDLIAYVRIYLKGSNWKDCSWRSELEQYLEELFVTLRRFFGRFRNIPDSVFHYAASHLGNECKQAGFHLYHSHLESRWLFLTMVYEFNTSGQNSIKDFEDVVEIEIEDLIYMSLKTFERVHNLADLKSRTPYNCTCVREFYLILQLMIEHLVAKEKTSKTWWDYVNVCLNKIIKGTISDEGKIFWHRKSERSLLAPRNPELFSIWMIYHLTLLCGYDKNGVYLNSASTRVIENYDQVQETLKAFINKGGKDGERDEIDDELKVMIPLLKVIAIDWWPSRVPIISSLWDCFHRRLDHSFLVQTSGPWTASLDKKEPQDILKQLRDRIEEDFDQNKDSSFGMFLKMLGTFLKKEPKNWNQVKGRIFSKFSTAKVEEYSESGIYNFISLFLTSAITATDQDTESIVKVMLGLLPKVQQYNQETAKRDTLVWKGRLVVFLLYANKRLEFESLSESFVQMVNVICCRKDEVAKSMMTSFIQTLGYIIRHEAHYNPDVSCLLGGWIDRYLQDAQSHRAIDLLQTLIIIIKKCNDGDISNPDKTMGVLFDSVIGRLRQLIFNPPSQVESYYKNVASLAVAFTLNALKNPTLAERHKQSAQSLFQHFANHIAMADVRITSSYLSEILKDPLAMNLQHEIKNFNDIVFQAWIKCFVLSNERNEDTAYLFDYMFYLDVFRRVIPTNDEFQRLKVNEDIVNFLMAIMNCRDKLQTENEKVAFESEYRVHFNKLDKWILIPINEETKDSANAEWIYKCIGTICFCCPWLLYLPKQPVNAYKSLINKAVLLSTEKNLYLKDLGKRVVPSIILGMEHLNWREIPSGLQGIITELFKQYLALLITEVGTSFKVPDTILKIFSNCSSDYVKCIFNILTSNFIKIEVNDKAKRVHKHCKLVIFLLRTILKGGYNYRIDVVDSVITICLSSVVDCYMNIGENHTHKKQTTDLILDVTRNPHYRTDPTIREKLRNVIASSTQNKNYVCFYPQAFFTLMRALCSIDLSIVEDMVFVIENSIKQLENNKRPNTMSLRFQFDQLKATIKQYTIR